MIYFSECRLVKGYKKVPNQTWAMLTNIRLTIPGLRYECTWYNLLGKHKDVYEKAEALSESRGDAGRTNESTLTGAVLLLQLPVPEAECYLLHLPW